MQKLGEILIGSKLINEKQLEAALEYQKKRGGKLGNTITELYFVKEIDIARAISQHIKVPYVNIFSEDFSDEELKKVNESIVRKYGVIPVRKAGHILEVAMSDPSDLDIIADVQFALGCTIKPLLSLGSEIEAFIRQYYSDTLVHRKSAKLVFPEEVELVQQRSTWENTPQFQAKNKIKDLVTLLVKKGVLIIEEAVHFIE
jgi:type II secretory ATPase GspE/PulE/Tfp pilus assembly ATPase PilB-like protein